MNDCKHEQTRYLNGNTQYRKCLDCGQTRKQVFSPYTPIEREIIAHQRR